MEKTTNRIIKIAILGAESTGKTALCEQLAKQYKTTFVPEFARDFFEKNDINNYNINDLIYIAEKQLELEKEKIKTANKFLFCDTSLITLKIWAENKFNTIPDFIVKNIQPKDYDLYLICNNDVVWIADPQRKDPELREHIFKWTKHELSKLSAEYHIIKGVNETKLKSATEIIDSFYQ